MHCARGDSSETRVQFPLFDDVVLFACEDEREGDDDGRGAGVRDPGDDHREAAVRPGREDDRAARGVVLRSPIHRQ